MCVCVCVCVCVYVCVCVCVCVCVWSRLLAVHCCTTECYFLLTAILRHRLVETQLLGPLQLMHSSLQQPTRWVWRQPGGYGDNQVGVATIRWEWRQPGGSGDNQVGMATTRWVWRQLGGYGDNQVGVATTRWVWQQLGGYGDNQVGVATTRWEWRQPGENVWVFTILSKSLEHLVMWEVIINLNC